MRGERVRMEMRSRKRRGYTYEEKEILEEKR